VTAAENIQAQLRLLIKLGTLPRSQCSGSFLKAVRPMLDGGVIAEEKSGAGRRLVVRDAEALNRFCAQLFPSGSVPPGSVSRVAGVGGFRDSKTFASDTPEVVFVRSWRKDALTWNGLDAGAMEATAAHGLFAFLLKPESHYALHGPCALIENPALFAAFEQLHLEIPLAFFGQGRISRRFLTWLVEQKNREFSLAHLPDYDPAGLNEFERLRKQLGDRVRLFVPADLEQRFVRFANRKLLQKPNSRTMLAILRNSESNEVRSVVALIDRYNAGLEQESLLLS
jgi:hypothetical protein